MLLKRDWPPQLWFIPTRPGAKVYRLGFPPPVAAREFFAAGEFSARAVAEAAISCKGRGPLSRTASAVHRSAVVLTVDIRPSRSRNLPIYYRNSF